MDAKLRRANCNELTLHPKAAPTSNPGSLIFLVQKEGKRRDPDNEVVVPSHEITSCYIKPKDILSLDTTTFYLILYNLTSVCTFSIMFSIDFLWRQRGEFVEQNHHLLQFVIISFILMTLMFYSRMVFKGEIRYSGIERGGGGKEGRGIGVCGIGLFSYSILPILILYNL